MSRRRYPLTALAALCLAAAVVIVVLGSRLAFFNDDWYFLLQRPGLESHGGLDVLLAPHNSNLVFLTAGAYKLLAAVFGLGSQVPYRIVIALAVVAVGVFVFLLVARRAGAWLGVASAAIVLFLGPAWEDLLFFGAAVDIAGALATGLAALWLLDREQPAAWPACLLLVCSVGFSNVGLAFLIGAAAALLLRRRLAQLWVVAVPLVLFAAWWGFDGHRQPSHVSATNLEHLPLYLIKSLTAGIASATGLSASDGTTTYVRGGVVLGVLVAAGAAALTRGWPRREALVPLVTVAAFWSLTGASFFVGREALASRYQLVDVALLLVLVAELAGPVRLGRAGAVAATLLTVAIVSANLADRLVYGYRFMREQTRFVKVELGALELGRGRAPVDLWLVADIAHNPFLSGVTAGRFFAETAAYGAVPVDTVAQIEAASVIQREGADSVLARAERLTPYTASAEVSSTRGCTRLSAGGSGANAEIWLTPGIWQLSERDGRGLVIGVRRFGPVGLPAYIGLIRPGLIERMSVPADAVPAPWKLSATAAVSGTASLVVCPT